MTPAYLIVWRCHCGHLADSPDDLPDRCPGHDQGPIVPRAMNGPMWEQFDAHPDQPRGHQCPDVPWMPACPAVQHQLDLEGEEG